MSKRLLVQISAILIFGLGFCCHAWAQSAAPEMARQTEPETVGSATMVAVHGKIVDVNTAQRLVTLEGPEGRRVTVYVRNPDNLRAAKVGEPFAARFYEVITIRKKIPDENIRSASLQQVYGRLIRAAFRWFPRGADNVSC